MDPQNEDNQPYTKEQHSAQDPQLSTEKITSVVNVEDGSSNSDEPDVEKSSHVEDNGCKDCAAKNELAAKHAREVTSMIFLKVLAMILAGVLIGVAFEKSKIYEPENIRAQFVMRRFVMLKMFLAAVASGQLCLAILSLLPLTKHNFAASADSFKHNFEEKGILSSTVGAFILGCGMAVSGACPGMVLAQVGSWAKNSIFTLLGVFLGALLHGLTARWLIPLLRPRKRLKILSLHQQFNIPYAAISIPLSLMVLLGVGLLEYFLPWYDDLSSWRRNDPSMNFVRAISWPPSIAGIIIGLMQNVVVLGVEKTLGGSSGYCTVVSQWVVTKRLQDLFPTLAKARRNKQNWWQVLYWGAAVVGAMCSAMASDTFATAKGVTIECAIFGGILMVFGSRCAAGCTSGHGLSGFALLQWLSFIAVPCMFGGGIVVGFIMQATGALCQWDYHDYHVPIHDDTFC